MAESRLTTPAANDAVGRRAPDINRRILSESVRLKHASPNHDVSPEFPTRALACRPTKALQPQAASAPDPQPRQVSRPPRGPSPRRLMMTRSPAQVFAAPLTRFDGRGGQAPRLGARMRFMLRGAAHYLIAVAALGAGAAQAQLPQPQLYAVSPSGGKLGATFDLTISAGL